MLEKLQGELFSAHIDTTFRVFFSDDASTEAVLIKVEGLHGDTPEESERQPFSLIFRCPKDSVVEQKVYRIEHGVLDAMELFLVPIGPDKEGMLYEAVFS